MCTNKLAEGLCVETIARGAMDSKWVHVKFTMSQEFT
jgi:hypothetical protein